MVCDRKRKVVFVETKKIVRQFILLVGRKVGTTTKYVPTPSIGFLRSTDSTYQLTFGIQVSTLNVGHRYDWNPDNNRKD